MTMVELEPAVEEQVRYLAGRVSEGHRRSLDRRTASSEQARKQCIQVLDCMDALQTLSPADLKARSEQPGLEGEVAQTLLAMASETCTARLRALIGQGVEALQAAIKRGSDEALAAVQATRAFSDHVAIALSQPQVGLARGAESDDPVIRVGEDGSLTVRGSVKDAADGDMATIVLHHHGESIPIASATVANGQVDWTDPGLGESMGLPIGQLPSELVRIDPAESPETQDWPIEILANYGEEPGGQDSVAPIEILGRPAIRGGEMFIDVRAPAATLSLARSDALKLELTLSDSVRLLLGSWPLGDWDSEPRTLVVPFPIGPDAEIPFVSLLHASLIKPKRD